MRYQMLLQQPGLHSWRNAAGSSNARKLPKVSRVFIGLGLILCAVVKSPPFLLLLCSQKGAKTLSSFSVSAGKEEKKEYVVGREEGRKRSKENLARQLSEYLQKRSILQNFFWLLLTRPSFLKVL